MLTVIGDPHAKPGNLDKINTLFDMVEDLGNNTVWLGDLLDTKEVVRGSCINTYIKRFKESKLKHYILVGNHDWFNLDCKEHSLEALKELPNVTVVDTLQYLENMWFAPYTHSKEQLKEWVKLAGGQTLFCHADIQGFDYGTGIISEEGLTIDDFKKVRVISGHYHKHQQAGTITYLGTPFSHSFGESNQMKYIGLYDVQEGILELVETPFPRHITLEVDCSKQKALQDNPVDILRVILTGTQEQINTFQKRDHVKYIERPTEQVHESVVSEIDSAEEQFQKWAVEIKGYSKDILKRGLEILKDVQGN